MLTTEIERLNRMLNQKNTEIDEWRSRTAKLEGELVNMRQLQSTLSEYENRIALLTTEI